MVLITSEMLLHFHTVQRVPGFVCTALHSNMYVVVPHTVGLEHQQGKHIIHSVFNHAKERRRLGSRLAEGTFLSSPSVPLSGA